MPANFPTSLPGLDTDLDNNDEIASGHQNAARLEINALGAKVGIDSSAVTTSHDYKIDVLESEMDIIETGWISAAETWTYASATTFTITGDLTSKYEKGTKIRFKQGGAYKYLVVISASYGSPNTTITAHPYDSSTSIADATITDNYFSRADQPFGFPDKPYARAYRATSNQTIATSDLTTVIFNAETEDGGSNYNTSTGYFTAPIAGVYHAYAVLSYESTAGGVRENRIAVNGSSYSRASNYGVSGMETNLPNGLYWRMSKGDAFRVFAYQTTGGNLDLILGEDDTWFGVTFLHP